MDLHQVKVCFKKLSYLVIFNQTQIKRFLHLPVVQIVGSREDSLKPLRTKRLTNVQLLMDLLWVRT